MKNLKFCLSFLIFTSFLLTACSVDDSGLKTNESTSITVNSAQTESSTNTSTQTKESISESTEKITESTPANNDIAQKTKDYILNEQQDLSEAEKIKWSKTFLDLVNIDDIYQEYLSSGGIADDIQSFAQYLTLNAPIPDNWQELAEDDLYNTYGEKITRFEYLQNDLYQAYIEYDNSEVPYVVVNSRTGYFHG